MVSIKRVFYSFNSQLEKPYNLDIMVLQDNKTLVDKHGAFKTLEEFNAEVESILPVLCSEEDKCQTI